MPTIDWPLLINWIVSGLIGFAFGTISTWIAYRYERKRDDIAWQREKEKLQQQHAHDREMLEIQSKQRIKELEEQLARERASGLRDQLVQGIDNPQQTIENLQRSQVYIRGVRICVSPESLLRIAAEFRKFASESRNVLTRLQTRMVELANEWEGMEKQAFYKKWQEFVNIMNEQINISEKIAQELTDICERFKLADQI